MSRIHIVGAGITGLYASYWLEQLTDHEIILYDKLGVGAGASSRNAGFITAGSSAYRDSLIEKLGEKKAKKVWNFCLENISLQMDIFNKLAIPYKHDGAYTYREGKKDFLPHDLQLNPKELCVSLFKSLKRTIYIQKPFRLPLNNKATDTVLWATNNYKNHTTAQRAQIQRLINITGDVPAGGHYFPSDKIYLKKEGSDLVIGGLRMLDEKKEQTNQALVNPFIQERLTQKAVEFFGIKYESRHMWAGIMSFTESTLPVHIQEGNQHFIGGYSGHGNGFACMATKRWVEGLEVFPFF